MLKNVRSPVWRAILIFALAGPLIGSAPFALIFAFIGFQLKDGPIVGLLPLIFGLVLGLPLALLAGCTFAAANALANGVVTRSLSRAIIAGAISSLFAAVVILALFPDGMPSHPSDKTPSTRVFFYMVSTIAGAVCGAFFLKWETSKNNDEYQSMRLSPGFIQSQPEINKSRKLKFFLLSLTTIVLVLWVIHWINSKDGGDQAHPAFVIGDLGGMKVNIPSYYVDLLEYEGDPGWLGKPQDPKPVRTHQSRITSFGVTVRYPDMAGLSSPAMWADKDKYTAADTPWISIGFISGPIYPGDGFMERGAQRVIDSNGTRSQDIFKKEGEKIFAGLDLYVQQGTSIDGRPRRDSEPDIYIYQSKNGRIKTDIRCSNEKFPAVLCQQKFSMEDDGLQIKVTIRYRRTMLEHWQDMQEKARHLVLSWKALEAPAPTTPAAAATN